MPKSSNNPIPSLQTPWSLDPLTQLPFSGASVEALIKRMFNAKVGAGWFDTTNMTLYLFRNDEDKQNFIEDPSLTQLLVGSVPINFSTTQHRIYVTTQGGTTINASVNQEEIMLEMGVVAQTKEITDHAWQPTGQDVMVRVYIDRNNTGNYEEIPALAQKILSSVGSISVNIRDYVSVGLSRVRFYFYAEDDPSLSTSIVWNITLALMYIEPMNSQWDKALIEGVETNYRIGGFKIVGSVPKTLHIEVRTSTTLKAYYAYDIGRSEYIDNAFYFSTYYGLNLSSPVDKNNNALPPLTTGIYNVKIWLSSGNLSTEDNAISYNIMYIAAGESASTALVVMNNSGKTVNNYDEAAHLCDYAIYNKGESYGVVTIHVTPRIQGNPGTTVTQEVNLPSEQKQSLNYSINMVTNDPNLSITYSISIEDGNNQEDTSRVDNTEIFQSVDGASFYLNTSLRSNGDTNKEILYNTANNGMTPVDDIEWEHMSWVDGVDGWTEDENGRKCLMLPARTRLTIPNTGYRFLTGTNVAFELCYRVANVSDYSENIITISSNPESTGFTGIRIKPTNVTVHSLSDVTAANDTYQGTNIADEETIHLIVTIQDSFNGQAGYNLVTGFVNGTKAFQFSYVTGTTWADPLADAVFGSDTADLYLYMFRVYNGTSLAASGAEQNWINTMFTRNEKVISSSFIKSVLGSSGSRNIDYETVKNSGKYNFFVIEMTEGFVPDKTHPDGGKSNIEMHFGNDADGNARWAWDWKIYDVETRGQGTTSMNYFLWNIRWRIDKTDSSKKRDIAYYDTPVISSGSKQFVELPFESKKTVRFDGGNHPEVKRITAKINFASSMQSHKMGATKAYGILHDSLEEGALLNEAQQAAIAQDKPSPVVAVYQYPAFGFERSYDQLGTPSYRFIGLFTIGPDKGDKPTFGYDLVENDLVSLEGVDHTPQMTKFNVPWDEQTVYAVNDNGDGYLATKAQQGNVTNALEVGNAKNADTGDPTEAMPVMIDAFKPAYDVVYDNSTLIFPIALADTVYGGADAAAVLANINADIQNFRSVQYNSRLTYADMEFWIEGEYLLYHFEYESQTYVSGYKSSGVYSPLDLRTDTGVTPSGTLEEQNEQFKAARRARFKAQAPTYWDMRELVFNYVYLLIFAATDNFAKNQYPMYMGGKWRFRQDDLDTILDIDNNGGQTKPAYIEYDDAVGGSPYFAGSNSVLWNLVHESLWDDFTFDGDNYPGIRTMGREMLEMMSSKANGVNMFDGFIKFFDKYFWSNAQEYFPPSAYNIDGNIKYESAWLSGNTFSVFPLRQSLGSHHSAERLWVRRRAVYCMSLFKAGAFGDYSQNYLGAIMFRPTALGSLTVIPAETMYPCVIDGNNNIRQNARTNGGEPYVFVNISGDGNTTYTIQAVNSLVSLGNLKHLKLGSDDGGLFNVSGKKLREFKMCDDDPTEVDTNVTTLKMADEGLPCLEVLDLHNAQTLTGTLDLRNCKRVKEVYLENTQIAAVSLPRGSKVEKLHLSDYITVLSYQVVKYLSDLVLPSDTSAVSLVYLEECDALDGMETLEMVYSATGQTLQYIKIILRVENLVTASQLTMLSHIKQNLDKEGSQHLYFGVNGQGNGDVQLPPHIEGRLLADKYYQADIDELADGQTPADSTTHQGYKEITVDGNDGSAQGIKGPLRIAYPLGDNHAYLPFEDTLVQSICVNKWGDGVGVLRNQVTPVTTIKNVFAGNRNIVKFNELREFTNVKVLTEFEFFNCSSLVSLDLSNITSVGRAVFQGSALVEIILENVVTIGSGSTTYAPMGTTSNLKKVVLGPNCTTIGAYCFNASGVKTVVVKATTPPTVGTNIFNRVNLSNVKMYVPYSSDHSILDAYKNTTNLTNYASNIYELNEDGTIPE